MVGITPSFLFFKTNNFMKSKRQRKILIYTAFTDKLAKIAPHIVIMRGGKESQKNFLNINEIINNP